MALAALVEGYVVVLVAVVLSVVAGEVVEDDGVVAHVLVVTGDDVVTVSGGLGVTAEKLSRDRKDYES